MIRMDDHDPAGKAQRLTAEEDAVLRRLHFFEASGVTLALPVQALKAELMARDQRTEIREPQTTRILWPATG